MSGFAAIGARPDHDLDVLIERGEELHQAFDGDNEKHPSLGPLPNLFRPGNIDFLDFTRI